jgi:hypothetical protein
MTLPRLIGLLVVFAVYIVASSWLDQIVAGRLTVQAYGGFESGRSVGSLVLILALNLSRPRIAEDNQPASVGPAGNRALHSVGREVGRATSPLLYWGIAALISTLIVVMTAADLIYNLGGNGDRPVEFLAGVGSVIVAAVPSVGLFLALTKLSLVIATLMPRRPTPAPAP